MNYCSKMLAGARSRHTEQKGKDHAMASYLSVVMSGELNSLGRLCPCLWAQRVDILPSLSVRMFTWDFSEAAQATAFGKGAGNVVLLTVLCAQYQPSTHL
jgi:hypothetical protein